MAIGARSDADGPDRRRTDKAHEEQGEKSAAEPDSESPDGGNPDDGSPDGGERVTRKKQRSFLKELPLLVGIALILALLIKTFLIQAFSIPSDSMQNTLQRGDRVLVDKLTPWFGAEPERGEVVVFGDPGGWLDEAPDDSGGIGAAFQEFMSFIGLLPSAEEQDLIKRVIAVGGDTVACEKNGPVTVNGKALDEESYIYPGSTPCGSEGFGPVEVPEGRLWVMGDNRQNSLDSRFHQELPGQGTVPVDEVVGRAVVRAWPIDRWGTLPVPDTFEKQGLAMAPAALGLAGAVPLVLLRRRLRAPGAGGAPGGTARRDAG
ncbi:signal peptidase I [Streptomyces sp. TRM 70361]|uniref:signal peptidase I n=1 Tax=Streptomyces sp. TRM 70361 TaxID=3116553 RepID=UPI002E7AF93E|nr:signal peptidase I [Streptomyces sp. TRM 70361]MEE1941846.1 signal peptidase I [Streptomyces sp. TRM 70361]